MTKEKRKQRPMFKGLRAYFPDALLATAFISYLGNKQHYDAGEEIHWDRSKSPDDLDAADRHLTDRAKGRKFDDDGGRHLAKAAWRILAALQKEIEEDQEENQQYIVDNSHVTPESLRRQAEGGLTKLYPSKIMGSDGKDHDY